MSSPFKAAIAASIVGLVGWAFMTQARNQKPIVEPVVNDMEDGSSDLAGRLTTSFFSILRAVGEGDQSQAQQQAQTVADDLLSTWPIEQVVQRAPDVSQMAEGAGWDLGGLVDRVTTRIAVDVPSTSAAPAALTGLTKAKGTETRYGVTVQYAMGPKRPYRPGAQIVDLTARGVAQTYGAGSRMVITSGQEGDLPQHGSNRHKTGQALDTYILKPSGKRVQVAEFDQLARNLARIGAKGIGWGPEYMGNTIHVDRVMPGAGQAHTWGSRGRAMRSEIMKLMGVA